MENDSRKKSQSIVWSMSLQMPCWISHGCLDAVGGARSFSTTSSPGPPALEYGFSKGASLPPVFKGKIEFPDIKDIEENFQRAKT